MPGAAAGVRTVCVLTRPKLAPVVTTVAAAGLACELMRDVPAQTICWSLPRPPADHRGAPY